MFEQAIDRAEPAEEVKQRVINLIDSITYSVFVYTTRGLFERDKLIFTAQMTFLVSTRPPFSLPPAYSSGAHWRIAVKGKPSTDRRSV